MFDNAPLWTAEPRNLPYRDSLATSHLPGWPAPISRQSSESVAKYVVVDMFAKACAGKSTKDVIADAKAQLKLIFKSGLTRCRRTANPLRPPRSACRGRRVSGAGPSGRRCSVG